ncbi:MAG: hypothetical protein ACRC6U_10405 [Fusobacteriaceae bacterium]
MSPSAEAYKQDPASHLLAQSEKDSHLTYKEINAKIEWHEKNRERAESLASSEARKINYLKKALQAKQLRELKSQGGMETY